MSPQSILEQIELLNAELPAARKRIAAKQRGQIIIAEADPELLNDFLIRLAPNTIPEDLGWFPTREEAEAALEASFREEACRHD